MLPEASTHGERLGADHRTQPGPARTRRAASHQHQPVDAAGLIGPAVQRRHLVEVLHEAVPHEHQRPRSGLQMRADHGGALGEPRRPRSRPAREEGVHLGHVVTRVGICRRFVLVLDARRWFLRGGLGYGTRRPQAEHAGHQKPGDVTRVETNED